MARPALGDSRGLPGCCGLGELLRSPVETALFLLRSASELRELLLDVSPSELRELLEARSLIWDNRPLIPVDDLELPVEVSASGGRMALCLTSLAEIHKYGLASTRRPRHRMETAA